LILALIIVVTTSLMEAVRSEAGPFVIETIDSAPYAMSGRLALTPAGGLVFTSRALGGTPAYYVSGSGTPYSGRVFERTGSGWHASASMPPVDISFPHAMSVDADGWRHFLSWQYPASDSSGPLLQDEGPGGWTATVLDTSATLGLAVVSPVPGDLWAAYLRVHRFNCCFDAPYELVVAHRTAQGWSRDSLQIPMAPVWTPWPFAVDAQGRPHVLYVGIDYHGLYHAVRAAGGWQVSLVDSGYAPLVQSGIGYEPMPQLLVGADGTAHALYRVGAALRYAHQSGDAWVCETLPFEVVRDVAQDMALDHAGKPRFAFVGTDPPDSYAVLKYAYCAAAGWVSDVVVEDFCFYDGAYLSLVLDAFDRPAIGFPGPCTNEVSVATLDATAGVTPGALDVTAGVRLSLASGNPARLGGVIRWRLALPEAADVTLEAFDLAGRRLASSPARPAPRGESTFDWTPQSLPSGSCFVRARTVTGQSQAAQLFLMR
jgi:hypothetical protein